MAPIRERLRVILDRRLVFTGFFIIAFRAVTGISLATLLIAFVNRFIALAGITFAVPSAFAMIPVRHIFSLAGWRFFTRNIWKLAAFFSCIFISIFIVFIIILFAFS